MKDLSYPVAILSLGLILVACKTQSDLPPTQSPTRYPGSVYMTNSWTLGLTLSAFDDGSTGGAIWTGAKVAAGQTVRHGGVPSDKSIVLKTINDAVPPTNYTLVQDGASKAFFVSSLRSYDLAFKPDPAAATNMVWSWALHADPGFEVSSLAVAAGIRTLTLTWKDPAMSDLVSVKIYDRNTHELLATVSKGIQAAALTDLAGGVPRDLAIACAYPEIESRGASASGTPLSPASTPVAPTIAATSPISGATAVPVATASISATFSASMNAATFTSSSFSVKDGAGGAVAGSISVTGATASFAPGAPLAYGTTYTATVTTAVESSAGASLAADFSWSFTTPPPPLFKAYAELTASHMANKALAVGDLNGDGLDDIALVTGFDSSSDANSYKLMVFLQKIGGGFSSPAVYPTAGGYTNSPISVAIGDVNGDGRKDAVVGELRKGLELFLQDPSGALSPGALRSTQDSSVVVIADLNGDRRLDIAGIDWGNYTASVWYQNADKSLPATPSRLSVSHGGYDALAAGDLNGDGRNDLVVMSGQSNLPNIGLLLQSPTGILGTPAYFNVAPSTLTSGIAIGDVTGDGRDDIVASYGGNVPKSRVAVFAQGIDGTIPSSPTAAYAAADLPEALAIADIDGDGKKDVIVVQDRCIGVYLQQSAGELGTEITSEIPSNQGFNSQAVAVGDLNGDGKADDIVAVTDFGLAVLIKY